MHRGDEEREQQVASIGAAAAVLRCDGTRHAFSRVHDCLHRRSCRRRHNCEPEQPINDRGTGKFDYNCFGIPVAVENDVCVCCSANRLASITDEHLPGTKKMSVKKRRHFSLRGIYRLRIQTIRGG